MPPPTIVTPCAALEAATTRGRRPTAALVPVREARGLPLAEPVETSADGAGFPGDDPSLARASVDGFVLPRGAGVGDELEVIATVGVVTGRLDSLPASGTTCRVECGVAVPEAARAVLAVLDASVVGPGRIRVDRLPQDGDGVVGVTATGTARAHPAGCIVDARFEAFLLAKGRREISVIPRPRVGVLAFGEELCDLVHGVEPSGGRIPDLGGYWLQDALRALGPEVVDLGVVTDDPTAFWRALHGCRSRDVEILVISGGLGDGLSDRAVESVREARGHIVFDRVDMTGCGRFLLGRCQDMDVYGLSGEPLAMAAAFDLFLRPALLARRGVADRVWDWRRRRRPHRALVAPPVGSRDGTGWVLQAAEIRPPEVSRPDSEPFVCTWTPESPFAPLAAGATGWALWDRSSDDGRVHYVPLALTAGGGGL